MSQSYLRRFPHLFFLLSFLYPVFCIHAQSRGVHVATLYGQPGETVDFMAKATLPISKEASPFFIEDEIDEYGFVVVDPRNGSEIPAQKRTILFHHGVGGASPALTELTFPVTSTSSAPMRFEVYVRPTGTIQRPNNFSPSASQLDFLQNGQIQVRVPGRYWGWKADIQISGCDVKSEKFLTMRLRCSARLIPDANFTNQIESSLAINIFLEVPREKEFVRMSFKFSNTNTAGAFHVPFERMSVTAKLGGNGLSAYGHTYTFRGKSEPHYRHVIQQNGRIDYFPQLSANKFHVIPEDYAYSSAEYVVSLNGPMGALGQDLADVTRAFIPQSETGNGPASVAFNWLMNSPLNVKIPDAKQFYSNAELRTKALSVRSEIFGDQAPTSAGNPFAFSDIHPDFPLYFGGMARYGTAGGWGIQFAHHGNILLANGGMNGHREVIESSQGFTDAQNNRFKVSFMIDDYGNLLTAEELLAKANGDFIHVGNNWHVHYASPYNPNKDRQLDPDVQALEAIAINASPYAPELIGYYETVNGEVKWRNTPYSGGTDGNHSVRYHPYGILGCLQAPTENCLFTLEMLGNAIFAFRQEGSRPTELSTVYENNLRTAQADAARGIFGSVVGRRDKTDSMFVTLGLQLRENPGNYILSRIALLSDIISTNMAGKDVFAAERKLDPRDFSKEQRDGILEVSAQYYGFTIDPFLRMDDEVAKARYCTWDSENQRWINCQWPNGHRCQPTCAVVNKINDEGIKVQSNWEGVYAVNSLQHLLHHVRNISEISAYTRPAISAVEDHLRSFNNTCEGNVDYKSCGFGPNGNYGWITLIGRPLNPLPPQISRGFTSYSSSASYYMYMSAIDKTMNFERDRFEGYQTWQRISSEVAFVKANVFDQWRSDILAWYQTFNID